MTIQPDMSHFFCISDPVTLVIFNMCKSNVPLGLKSSRASTVINNCKIALGWARRYALPVAFMTRNGSTLQDNHADPWIEGFAPQQMDKIFYRRSLSCFSSPYFFDSVAGLQKTIVLAGFLGDGGCIASCYDGLMAGFKITVLTDAIIDHVIDSRFLLQSVDILKRYTGIELTAITTVGWGKTLHEKAQPISL